MQEFYPWSGRIPQATEQLSLSAATAEPGLWGPGAATTEPGLWGPGAATAEPGLWGPGATTTEPGLESRSHNY